MAPASVRFVTRKWPPTVGGMETYSARLAEGLDGRVALDLIHLPGIADGGAPSAPRLIGFGLRAAWALLTRAPCDITHIADMAIWPLALAARLRSKRTRLVLSAHGTDVTFPRRGGWKARAYGAYLRLGARLLPAAEVIANSAHTAAAAAEHGFTRLHVVALATDLVAAEGIHADPDVVLFAGRLIPAKGCAWFIRNVLPRLPDPIHLQVAGTAWDADEAAALDQPRVRYLGPLDRAALRSAYAGALCTVVPNIDDPRRAGEGFGLIATEAAGAGGIPLVARRDGLVEAVIDGETGILLPPGDAAAWAAAILDLRGWDPGRRAAFLHGAALAVASHFSWDRVVRDVMLIYGIADD